MGQYNRELGKYGEDKAVAFLKRKGLRIIERNFRCRYGEIDIIADDKGTIVFCEVKTRTSGAYGDPREAVNYYKRRHMTNTAKYYLQRHIKAERAARFDVMEVVVNKDALFGKVSVNHITDAF